MKNKPINLIFGAELIDDYINNKYKKHFKSNEEFRSTIKILLADFAGDIDEKAAVLLYLSGFSSEEIAKINHINITVIKIILNMFLEHICFSLMVHMRKDFEAYFDEINQLYKVAA